MQGWRIVVTVEAQFKYIFFSLYVFYCGAREALIKSVYCMSRNPPVRKT